MYERERKELAEKLFNKGIQSREVLNAIESVERHLFVPPAFISHAHKDAALPIGSKQTISQPYTVAFMTESLGVKKDSKILEIGTGSGYQAAVLAKMGARVYSIERQYDLYERVQKLFDKLQIRAHVKYGDGTIGWEEFAPYDGIIVTAGSPNIPTAYKKQLAVGGVLVIPVGDKNNQVLKIITKTGPESFHEREVPDFTFVPLIGREGWTEK